MILRKNNLQTVQDRNKSYIELIALSLYVHPKNSIIFDESRATKALDHSRLANLHICNLGAAFRCLKGRPK